MTMLLEQPLSPASAEQRLTFATQRHHDAMNAAELGLMARRQGDASGARRYFREAMELERQAAEMAIELDVAEPSRSILLRSAASLALQCQAHAEASELINWALAGQPPAPIEQELLDLAKQCESATGRAC